jgi:phytoene dehydrogenase-like protein
MLAAMLSVAGKMKVYEQMSTMEYSQKFKHPAIRTLIQNVVGKNLTVSAMLFTLGCFASGDGGYIEGGSLVLARNMEKRFTDLGGEIRYGARVEKVVVEDGDALGVMVNGEFTDADTVIVTADTLSAVDRLFDPPLHEEWMDQMRKNTKPTVDTFVSIGIECDLSGLPESMLFSLDQPVTIAGI